MVEAAAPGDAPLTFEAYMRRFENSNIYFSKLMDFATSPRMTIQERGKAINMAIGRAKTLKKIG